MRQGRNRKLDWSIVQSSEWDNVMAAPGTPSITQEQFLDAVLSCLAEGGIAGVSMRAVAAGADVSLGLLSCHLAGKQALVAEAVHPACDRLIRDSLTTIDDVVGADDGVRDRETLERGLRRCEDIAIGAG